MQFTTKNSLKIDPDITCANKLISDAYDTKFLWIFEDSKLSWKTHTEQTIQKLSAVCYAVRSVKPCMPQKVLKMLYYACFHSITNYGSIL